jgi:5'-nucleotidase
MDIALGHLGGSKTILVRSGMSGTVDLNDIPERQRPHAVVDGVRELLDWL